MTTTDPSVATAPHHTGFNIIVNTEPHRVATDIVSYDQVAEIAFPGHPHNPNVYFEVLYNNAESKPRDGSLDEGGTVTVKNGTNFRVSQTDRS